MPTEHKHQFRLSKPYLKTHTIYYHYRCTSCSQFCAINKYFMRAALTGKTKIIAYAYFDMYDN